MKIFSSFDTNFKQEIINNEEKKYWNDKIKLISHGKIYYYFFILFPTIFVLLSIIFYIIILFLIWQTIPEIIKSIYYIVWFIFLLIIFVPSVIKLIKKYIDYILDFLIITPDSAIYYNQEWILNRKWRTIDVEKIKTITVNKKGILQSTFNFWNIVILTEWDEQWQWEINFHFVDDPDNVKHDIFNIINSVEHPKDK